jgi:hypothetical protein
MCVSGMPGAQSCKCSCEVTFSQPKHSFVTMVATPFLEQWRGPGGFAWWRRGSCRAAHRIVAQSRATRHVRSRGSETLLRNCSTDAGFLFQRDDRIVRGGRRHVADFNHDIRPLCVPKIRFCRGLRRTTPSWPWHFLHPHQRDFQVSGRAQ